MSATAVAWHFLISVSTIPCLRHRHQQIGTVYDRLRSGRPRKTTQRDDQDVHVTSRRNRFMPAPNLANQFYRSSSVRVSV